MSGLLIHPDRAAQEAGVLIAFLGMAVLLLIQTARSRR